MSETVLAFVAVGGGVGLLLALLTATRWRRRRAGQYAGSTFSAAEFASLIDNLAWYGHSSDRSDRAG